MKKNLKEWTYLGKTYRWTKKPGFKGRIDCTCAHCQKYVKSLVKSKQLKRVLGR